MHNKDTFTGPSFSLKNRIQRMCWKIAYSLFFRLSPRPLHKWRAFILRCFGAKIGKGVHVYPSVKIWAPWNIELKDECGVGDEVKLYSQGKITIGYRTVISQGCHLCAGTHDYNQRGFPLVTKPIIIADHVWLTAEVFVHPGIIVHEGCIVGARSVVTKDLPAWHICGGHPCKPLKPREKLY